MKRDQFSFAVMKDNYLEAQKSSGGHAEGFREYSLNYAEKHIEKIPSRLDLFARVCTATWGNKIKPKWASGDLMLDDKACPGEIKFADKDAPGGYLTVKFTYCTTVQFRLHSDECDRVAKNNRRSADIQHDILIAAEKRALIVGSIYMADLCDGQFDLGKTGERSQ